jgi:hypothetical protein
MGPPESKHYFEAWQVNAGQTAPVNAWPYTDTMGPWVNVLWGPLTAALWQNPGFPAIPFSYNDVFWSIGKGPWKQPMGNKAGYITFTGKLWYIPQDWANVQANGLPAGFNIPAGAARPQSGLPETGLVNDDVTITDYFPVAGTLQSTPHAVTVFWFRPGGATQFYSRTP